MRIEIIPFLFLLLSCSSENSRFIREFGEQDFHKYLNKGVALRGFESPDIATLLINPNLRKNNGFYRISINMKTLQIIHGDAHLMKDSSGINRKELEKLAIDFIRYKVYTLYVDSAYNVYINASSYDRANLLRLNDNSVSSTIPKGWEQVSGSWYAEK